MRQAESFGCRGGDEGRPVVDADDGIEATFAGVALDCRGAPLGVIELDPDRPGTSH